MAGLPFGRTWANETTMKRQSFSDATLILAGHGTSLNSESSAAIYQHATDLRRTNLFAEIKEAFWKQEPKLVEVVNRARTPRVFVLPFMMSEGFFCEKVIPNALAFQTNEQRTWSRFRLDSGRTLFYCKPLGTHPKMTRIVLARAQEVLGEASGRRPPDLAEITLFLLGHGTGQEDNSRRSVEAQMEAIRRLGRFAAVHALFLEEEPRIPECYRIARTQHIVLVPFFAGDGLHAAEDIPILLGEPEADVCARLAAGKPAWSNPACKQGKTIWYSASVGAHPLIAEVILARVEEASEWSKPGRANTIREAP